MQNVNFKSNPASQIKKDHKADEITDTNDLQSKINQLNKHINELRYLLDCTNVSTIVLDKDLNIKHFTPSITPVIRITKNDLGKNFTNYLKKFDDNSILTDIELVKTTNQTIEREINLKNGNIYLIKVMPYKDGYSHIHNGIVITFSDLTERKKIEEELILAKEKAEESDRLKSIFLSNISHEIRTPMNAILGFSNLISRSNIPEDRKNKYAEIIKRNGQQLINVIDDILDISQIELKQVSVDIDQFSISKMLSEFETQFNQEKIVKNKETISIKAILPKSSSKDLIYSDALRIQQILTNLLGNALKFTYKGKIEFGYEFTNGTYTFFIKDTGVGIAEDKIDIIFERFRQEDEAINKEFGGTGLGLTITKALVKILGGEIWVKSEKGKGSTFYFSIPEGTPSKSIVTGFEIEEPMKAYDFSGKTILLAEDDITSYQYFMEIFENTNIQLIYAKNGKEALDKFKENIGKIHLILLDIQMPVLNGYELAKQIRAIDKNIPILAQTAYAMKEEEKKCYSVGCNDYITKPIKAEHLLQKMEKLLKI
ncbi:MAG: response regulator [Bacteroidales bacterium]|nr:response regulator [Bacteroidales bacterium]